MKHWNNASPNVRVSWLKRPRTAEKANLGKTRFLAAASHDLLQPLNAARLFNAALRGQANQSANAQIEQFADRVENSLHVAEELLDGLLDISRLDSGAIHPERSHFSAGALLEALKEQFAPVAAQRNLELRVHAQRAAGLHRPAHATAGCCRT